MPEYPITECPIPFHLSMLRVHLFTYIHPLTLKAVLMTFEIKQLTKTIGRRAENILKWTINETNW